MESELTEGLTRDMHEKIEDLTLEERNRRHQLH